MKRRPRPKPPPSITPHRCVVVAVDPGERCGWSIWIVGRLAAFGELQGYDYDAARAVIDRAHRNADLPTEPPLPVVLVIERPFAANLTTAAGMGAARGVWLAAWQGAAGAQKRVVLVYPATWRAKVLPRGCASMRRELVQPIEQQCARQLVAGAIGSAVCNVESLADVGPDSAPAVLIGQWASKAGEVAKRLPRRAVAA